MEKHLFSFRIIVVAGLLLVTQLVSAQIEAGLWFVESSVGDFRREQTRSDEGVLQLKDTYSNVALYPVFGYMAGEHLAFGVRLTTGFEKWKRVAEGHNMDYALTSTRNTLTLEPFMRIYFPTSHYRTRPFIQFGGGKGYMSTREEYSLVQSGALTESEEFSRHDEYLQLDAELGLNYLLAPNVAVSSGVGYYMMYGKFDYNVQQGGALAAQNAFTRNGNSNRSAMVWRLGFALFLD